MASGPTTTGNGQIQKRSSRADEVQDLVRRMAPAMTAALPQHVRPDRMMRVVLTALRRTPALANCNDASLLGALMTFAQLGLEPGTPLGHAYLVPYGKECTPIVGYMGYIELARRSGLVKNIYAFAVREGDTFKYTLGLYPTLEHIPSDAADRESKPITHTYAVAHIRDAEPIFEVLSLAQIEARRKKSASGRNGPWVDHFEAMAKKSAIRALWKWLPKSAEMQRAQDLDDSGPGSALDDAGRKAIAAVGVVPPDVADVDVAGEEVPHDPETGEVINKGNPLDAEPD